MCVELLLTSSFLVILWLGVTVREETSVMYDCNSRSTERSDGQQCAEGHLRR